MKFYRVGINYLGTKKAYLASVTGLYLVQRIEESLLFPFDKACQVRDWVMFNFTKAETFIEEVTE
jgi:hypothetical protein